MKHALPVAAEKGFGFAILCEKFGLFGLKFDVEFLYLVLVGLGRMQFNSKSFNFTFSLAELFLHYQEFLILCVVGVLSFSIKCHFLQFYSHSLDSSAKLLDLSSAGGGNTL